jgi:hypothetical protein|tara:strand:- start:777 stop:1379 length:603 start_codon:yes stop_codon:yes gene_type:complete
MPVSATIDVYLLSYDNNKNLVQTPNDPIGVNLKTYLNEFRMITDEVNLKPGYIINFGVVFDVFSNKDANKQGVKLRCMDVIERYFNIIKLQFRQPIYVSQLEYELMGVEGVRAINHVCITQDNNYLDSSEFGTFDPPLWFTQWNPDAIGGAGGWEDTGTSGYGYKYNFQAALQEGVIRPSKTPAVFELKNPGINIKGRVR